MDKLPFVTIIMPIRNEIKHINTSLKSIVESNYPKDKLEILVVDGMSNDGTRAVLKEYSEKCPFIKILDNPKRIVPTALNMGIQEARGEIIIRMDAHTMYEKEYILKCHRYLQEFGADNVGGVWMTLAGGDTIIAESIALALSHPFGVGNAYYRIGTKEPKYVDTVPFGCYRREVFQKIGLFDEDLVRNQDDEFNFRLIRNGGKILLAPDITSYYYARDTLTKLWRMNFQYGHFKPLVARKIGAVATVRQLIPPVFLIALIISAIFSLVVRPFLWGFLFLVSIYFLASLVCSLSVVLRKHVRYLPYLPLVFVTLHFSYGVGYLKGIWDFVFFKKHKKKKYDDVHLSR